MEYAFLGNSGLMVSRVCLGCMGFGDGSGLQNWAQGYEKSLPIIKKALEIGINFFDTANGYGNGSSERILGRALKDLGVDRSKVVIASKVYFNEGKLKKEAIHRELTKSLERLGLDYLDLYIIHRFDYDTPILETMEALNDEIKAGRVRHIGASAMYAYQFAKMQDVAREHGLTPFISMQNHYNLIYREEEREMMKLLREEGVSSTPYSPLAAGRLSRPYGVETERSKIDAVAKGKYGPTEESDRLIIDRVEELSKKKGSSMTAISLSWLLHKDPVACPVVGASRESQLDAATEAMSVELTQEEMAYLEEPYVPHNVVGARDRSN